ncbi:hypothetical protein MUGA111182_06285 [Mucilaginibacter galii]|uniref:hypothetical protein n=1 Tax=Mucilaginibacter galii TaxID=2005073 RepID=UPI00166E276E|nr:hypothetical protein [Mucilaginibacter galii]
MKRFSTICLLTVAFFGVITLLTAKVETPFDGDDTYGFPLTFFKKFGGMTFPHPSVESETYYLPLFVDVLVTFVLAFVIGKIYRRCIKIADKKEAHHH